MKDMRKKTIIIGREPISMLSCCQLLACGIETAYFVDPEADGAEEAGEKTLMGKPLWPGYHLLYENPEEIAVLNSLPGRASAQALLDFCGLTESPALRSLCGAVGALRFDAFDPLTGYGRSGDVGAFRVLGREAEGTVVRIAVLGGAATDGDPALPGPGWVEMLHGLLVDQGIPNVIFNGAVSGYTSCEERDLALRDVFVLKPDLTLSFSGACDVPAMRSRTYPWYSAFSADRIGGCYREHVKGAGVSWFDASKPGREEEEAFSCGRAWLENQRIMHAALSASDIPFLGILQPPVFDGEEERGCYREIRTEISHRDFLTDLSALFDGKTGARSTGLYYSGEGNRLVAEAVCSLLMSRLPGERSRASESCGI